MSSLFVYFSNSVEFLYENLKKRLFTYGEPFIKRIIVVPNPAMKSWLMVRLASDKEVKIAAGVQITQLDALLQTSPRSLELSLSIEAEIRKNLKGEGIWQPLKEYLNSDQRITALSDELAHLFQLYGKYGEKMLEEWIDASSDWQQELWKSIYQKYGWPFLSDLKWELDPSAQVHLFCLSHLSLRQHLFFTKLPQKVCYYQLSPCQHFWSDLASYREACWLQRRLSLKNWNALEEYLRDCHPILANFGRLGREMALQIEESDAVTYEKYFLPSGALQLEPYLELTTHEEEIKEQNQPLTLLQAIQTDMLLLRNPKEIIGLTEGESVQIHSAPSLFREIQILHNNILDLIHRKGVQPGDIVVMAPDIMEYYPYIPMVFDETQVKYQINDVPVSYQSSLIKSFLFLLSLSLGRFDAHSVWQLFEDARFQKKQKWQPDDLYLIQRWLKEARVLWGENSAHRKEILQRNYCEGAMDDGQMIGTWEWAFGRLLEGLAMSHDEEFNALPIVETTEMDLLGRWIHLMRTLRDDLRVCTDGTAMSLAHWADYLQRVLESYFTLDSLSDADDALILQIEVFRTLPVEDSFTFATLFHQLEKSLTQKVLPYRERNLNAVRFSSLLPMRAVPADIIALLGMQEGSFPKVERKSPLDQLKDHPKRDFIPGQTDYDRYLFLELLLSARKGLLISYQGTNSRDGEKQAPSILVSEISAYCDQAYSVQGKKWSGMFHVEHPCFPFDSRYFSKDKMLFSYSEEHYRLALAYYREKDPPHSFIAQFDGSAPSAEISQVSISQLKAFAKNPIRAYFHQTLGMYLKDDKSKLQTEEPFGLNALDKYTLKTEAILQDPEFVLKKAEKEGRLPFGRWKQLACHTIHEEVAELKSTYADLKIEELFTIELSDKVQGVEKEGKNWKVPVLNVACGAGIQVVISGKLTEVCAEGFAFNGKNERADAIKAYPLLLVLSCLIKNYALPVKPQLLFTKSGHVKTPFYEDAEKQLAEYMGYYVQSMLNMSPLLPEFTHEILRKEGSELEKALSQKVQNPHQPFYNEELIWALQGGKLPEAGTLWKEAAEKIYKEMLSHWYE